MNVRMFLQWEKTSRDIIDFKRVYVHVADDVLAGLMLSEIVYWHLPSEDGSSRLRVEHDGFEWIAVTRAEWWDRVGLKPKQVDACIKQLVKLGIVEKKVYKFAGNPTTHLRLVWEVFLPRLEDFVEHPPENPYRKNVDVAEKPLFPNREEPSSRIGKNQVPKSGRSITKTTTEIGQTEATQMVTDDRPGPQGGGPTEIAPGGAPPKNLGPLEWNQFVALLGAICGIDVAIESNLGMARRFASKLWAAGYRRDDLERFEDFVKQDWRWGRRKPVEYPSLSEVGREIGKVKQRQEADWKRVLRKLGGNT